MIAEDCETEIKLCFRLEDLPALKSLSALNVGNPRVRRMSSTYFDTPDEVLRKRGMAFRVRQDGTRFVQTVKEAGTSVGNVLSRRESEAPVSTAKPDLGAISDPDLAARIARAARDGLRPVFRVDVERTTFEPASSEHPGVVIDIDVGEVRAGRRRKQVCELEIESRGAPTKALFDFALDLHESVPLRVSTVSKAERGYAMREGAAPSPAKAVRPALDAECTVEQALLAIVRSALAQVIANEPCVIETRDPEGIHQMRVGLRRLRSALRVFRSVLPAGQYDEIVSELRWLTSVLGPARDFDVFATEIVAPVLGAFPGDEAMALLQRRVETRRNRNRKAAREGVLSPRFTTLMLRLGAWLADGAWRNQMLSEEAARLFLPARTFASGALSKRYRKVRKLGKTVAELEPAGRHELRIEVKKLRYAIEFFGSLFDGKEVSSFSGRLARLQDDLGYLNDVRVADELTAELLASAPARDREALGAARGLVRGWHAHVLVESESRLFKDVKRLLKADPFWST